MPSMQHPTEEQRERRAAASAGLVRRVVEEACNQGDLAVLDALLAGPTLHRPEDPSGQEPELTPGRPTLGRLHDLLAAFQAAVPDARWTILELVAEGETVVTRFQVHGTFSGTLVGLAPPGRPATLTGVAVSRFAAGRLVDLWVQADLLGLLEQLGVMPPLGLTEAVTMAQVLRAGVVLAGGASP